VTGTKIEEFGKGDNCYISTTQQLTVIVDFTATTLLQSSDFCSRGSILININLISKASQHRVTFVLEALFPAYLDVFEKLFLELILNHVLNTLLFDDKVSLKQERSD